MFKVKNKYSKADIYKILKVPKNKQKGNWNTGYTQYNGKFYIFANIGVPGRTGVDHGNYWKGDDLMWHAKKAAKVDQPLMEQLRSSKKILVFTRENSRTKFEFEGHGIIKKMV